MPVLVPTTANMNYANMIDEGNLKVSQKADPRAS